MPTTRRHGFCFLIIDSSSSFWSSAEDFCKLLQILCDHRIKRIKRSDWQSNDGEGLMTVWARWSPLVRPED